MSALELAPLFINPFRTEPAKPLPADDPTRRRPDLTVARDKIGYKTLVSLEDGLKDTIPYYRKTLGM